MNTSKPIADNDDDSHSSGDSEVAFAFMDFSDVDFGDDSKEKESHTEEMKTMKEEETEKVDPSSNICSQEKEENSMEQQQQPLGVPTTMVLEGDLDILLNSKPTTLTTQQQYEQQQQHQRPLRTVVVNRVHAYDDAIHIDSQDKIAISIEHSILSNDCYIPGMSNTDSDDDKKVITLNGDGGDNEDGNNNTVILSQMIDGDEWNSDSDSETIQRIRTTARRLAEGRYVDVLTGPTSHSLFSPPSTNLDETTNNDDTVARCIRKLVMRYCTDIPKCIEVELFAVAALNLFLQVNYTGPSFHQGGLVRPGYEGGGGGTDGNGEDAKGNVMAAAALELLERINPHVLFASQLKVSSPSSATNVSETKKEANDAAVIDVPFQNAVLAELAVDGEWPCPVCQYPYFLLLARSILLTLADPNRPDWSYSIKGSSATTNITNRNGNNGSSGFASGDTIEFLEQSPAPSVNISNDTSAATTPTTINTSTTFVSPTRQFVGLCQNLTWCNLYSARAGVAHYRLLQVEDLPMTLWREVEVMFEKCISTHCRCDDDDGDEDDAKEEGKTTTSRKKYLVAAKVMLEYGLAEHHFDMNKKGKESFQKALHFSGLTVEVTGAEGRRTKYQKKATAQMLVRAEPKTTNVKAAASTDQASKKTDTNEDKDTQKERVENQMIQHDEETILLNKVKYVSSNDNVHYQLTILEQVILLALCLDVKNDNPMDGLTGEQMGAFLERVLQQHDDWMVYATALLERAWLESERNHTRERAILQIQALADQHTNRLTLTQSTFQAAVEDSAPPQERLRNLHSIVYPPRWVVLRDLAERYAKIGIVTTAAELFEEIERWDDVVECYQRAGKENKAEEVIRKRLEEAETPRMWAALGDIKNDPKYYERALKVSNGRFSGAYVALGKFHSDKGDLPKAAQYFKEAVRLKPLSTHVWFRLGAISMNLKDWELALHAFSEVVQQEPEEADAWANVAAIHMHNKNPSEAYPALVESLKLNRNNWRVWASKLWTCMDLKKYDEAIQASITLIDLKTKRNASEKIPNPEERVIRAIVGGAISQYEQAVKDGNTPAVDSGKRTISRVRELLSKVKSSVKNEPWIFETCAFFNEKIGRADQVVEDLMKEYRALQNILGWETDSVALPRICRVITQLFELHVEEGKVESIKKFKFLVNGAIRKVRAAYFDLNRLPKEINELEKILSDIETKISKM